MRRKYDKKNCSRCDMDENQILADKDIKVTINIFYMFKKISIGP